MKKSLLRKQVYITERHDLFLKQVSTELQISEAEVLRKIIDKAIEMSEQKSKDQFIIKEDRNTVIYEVVKRVE